VDAGETVQLADGEGALALPRVERSDGIRYSRVDCTEDSWPAGRVFDLSASGTSRREGLPAFTMTQAVVVGPDVQRLQPEDWRLEREELQQPQDSALVLEWREVGPRPVVGGTPMAPDEVVVLRHMEVSEQRIFEALACRPAVSGYMEIPPEDLQRFSPDTDGTTYVNAQVELRWRARLEPASWGPMFSEGMTTFSGILKLRAPG
jgi:hypothetical protein